MLMTTTVLSASVIVTIVVCFTLSSPVYLALTLVYLALTLVYLASMVGSLVTPISIMFLLVYVGAMMIMVGYVCSVSPNSKSATLIESNKAFMLMMSLSVYSAVSLSQVLPSNSAMATMSIFLIEFYYSFNGVWFFFLFASTLLFLLGVTSYSYSPASTIRSL